MAELVDARDLKSLGSPLPCRFKSDPRHQNTKGLSQIGITPFALLFSLEVLGVRVEKLESGVIQEVGDVPEIMNCN